MKNSQKALIFGIATLSFYAAEVHARQPVKQDPDPTASIACSKGCEKQHGNGRVKSEAHNRNAYESCMVECMREAKKKPTSSIAR